MGNQLSLPEKHNLAKLHEHLHETRLRQSLPERSDLQTITTDTTLEVCLQILVKNGGVGLIESKGVLVGAIDIYCVVDFLLFLYKGTLEKRIVDVVHEEFDWLGFYSWVERKKVLTLANPLQIERVVNEGAVEFFALSVGG